LGIILGVAVIVITGIPLILADKFIGGGTVLPVLQPLPQPVLRWRTR